MKLSEEDIESLAVAVDFVLSELDQAEQRVSFPRPGEKPSSEDAENERTKRDFLKQERRRYKAIRARLVGNEQHGVSVAQEFLNIALGLESATFPDDDSEESYERWTTDQ
ncbi:hypothetical protein [Glutamicibacter sp. BW77]|uniref:hypothetical protein n=1 Tax=Glutamicibacter TaxID=1742989 RepID=UPI000BB9725C|nr:hypothetical protein [Glutamicibacter sp. BW77]PCC37064.1 hypothetical protein CIK74_02665 [Glutamicibacter sp. BW77]